MSYLGEKMTDLEKLLHRMENSLHHLETKSFSSQASIEAMGMKACVCMVKDEMLYKVKKKIVKGLLFDRNFCIKFKNPYLKDKKFTLGYDADGYYFVTYVNDEVTDFYKTKKKNKMIDRLSENNFHDKE